MALYGTEGLLKEANKKVPASAQVAAALLFLGAYAADRAHRKRLMEEAMMMNQMARLMESRRMQSTIDALGGPVDLREKRSSAELSAVEIGHLIAQMEKEAGIGAALGGLARLGARGLGRGMSAVGKRMPLTGTARMQAAQGAPGLGQRLQAWGARTPVAAPAAEAGKKSLLGWKGKALGLGAIGAVGYGGFKGLQAARDYMMKPTGYGGPRWGARPPLMTRVSPYGYPMY